MKLVNPLYYPLAIFAGGVTLVAGVRLAQLPNVVVLPTALAIATGLSIPLSQRQTQRIDINNPTLEREIQSAKQQTRLLTTKAQQLRDEARQLLTSTAQLELLAAIEYAADRILELPAKIDRLARKLQGSDSLLSPQELEQQLSEVQNKMRSSSGVARQQLNQLATSLNNNLQLARQGQDARFAQVISLTTIVTESAGVLQQLQNRLRISDLDSSAEINELKALSQELRSMQDNVDLLIL